MNIKSSILYVLGPRAESISLLTHFLMLHRCEQKLMIIGLDGLSVLFQLWILWIMSVI